MIKRLLRTKIRREALAHYDRMIEWAENRVDCDEEPCYELMDFILGEAPVEDNCAYCNKYLKGNNCVKCPLQVHGGRLISDGTN